MKVQTSRFGELDIDTNTIIHFRDGIPGFEQMKRYTLIDVKEHAPFSYLQSVDDGNLAFILIDPFECLPEYEFELPEQAIKQLQVETPDELLIRSIVTIKDSLETATLNLIAPIVINTKNREAKQVILTNVDYTTHHRLFSGDGK